MNILISSSCSLQCFKSHKTTHPDSAAALNTPAQPEVGLPQAPPPPPIPRYLKKKTDFSVLALNPKFTELLKTYPTLLSTLQRVYAATIEPDPDDQARRRRVNTGGFRGRGSRSRGRGGRFGGFNEESEGRWTQKKGDAVGMRELKKIRDGEIDDNSKEVMAAFMMFVEETVGSSEKKEESE